MRKKIKIVESNCIPDFEKEVNKLLEKNWEIRGNLLKRGTDFAIMMYKE